LLGGGINRQENDRGVRSGGSNSVKVTDMVSRNGRILGATNYTWYELEISGMLGFLSQYINVT